MPASLKRACVAEMPRAYIRISLCAITSYTDSLPLPGPPPATVYPAVGPAAPLLRLLHAQRPRPDRGTAQQCPGAKTVNSAETPNSASDPLRGIRPRPERVL